MDLSLIKGFNIWVETKFLPVYADDGLEERYRQMNRRAHVCLLPKELYNKICIKGDYDILQQELKNLVLKQHLEELEKQQTLGLTDIKEDVKPIIQALNSGAISYEEMRGRFG